MKTFTELLTERNINAAEYVEVVKAHGEETEYKSGPHNDGRYCTVYSRWIYDLMSYKGGIVILEGKKTLEQGLRHQFVRYGHRVVFFNKDGKSLELESRMWPLSKGRPQDAHNYRSKIIGAEEREGKWAIELR